MAAASSQPTAASLTLTGSVPVVDSGSVHIAAEALTVAIRADTPVQIAALSPHIGLVGDPADVVTLFVGSVATIMDDPQVNIAAFSVYVLRNPLAKKSFRAVWVG